MTIDFEVINKDIAGRVGKLRVNSRTVRTPALLPVINPHLPLVTPREMQEMGVEALITNAYIFRRSTEFCDQALAEGLHRVLDFDGTIMTDSGSFQLSVYGEVEVTNRETLEFQQAIGSDIMFLDIPTRRTRRGEGRTRFRITMDRIRSPELSRCNLATTPGRDLPSARGLVEPSGIPILILPDRRCCR